MRTLRDNQILRFIEEHRAITVKQCTDIFFEGNYRGCARRLQELEEFEYIESHISKETHQKTYQFKGTKHITDHDIGILNFYAWIYSQGGEVLEFKKEPRFYNNQLRPDAVIKFKIPYQGENYTIKCAFEYDLHHETDHIKLNRWYELLYKQELIGKFIVIIATDKPTNIYNSKNFTTIYTNYKFEKILQILLG